MTHCKWFPVSSWPKGYDYPVELKDRHCYLSSVMELPLEIDGQCAMDAIRGNESRNEPIMLMISRVYGRETLFRVCTYVYLNF